MYPGLRIQKLLDEQGVTQRELAFALHLNPNTVNGYIRNRRLPDCETVSRIADYLGTNTDYLLGNTNLRAYPELALNEQEGLLLSRYRIMPTEHKQILEDIAGTLLKNSLPVSTG